MTGSGPRLIEINYRSIGDYREFLLQESLGLSLFEIVLRLHMGEPLPPLDLAPGAALIRYFTAQSAGRLAGAPNAFDHRSEDMRISFKPLRAIGDAVKLTHSNKDYLGVLRGTGADLQRLGTEMDRISGELAWTIRA